MICTMALIATDLDGTIVRKDGTISGRVVEALHRRREHGDQIVFVTGRAPSLLGALPFELLTDGIVICSNGAIEFDVRTCRNVKVTPIDSSAAIRVVTEIRSNHPDGRFGAESINRTFCEDGYLLDSMPRIQGLTHVADVLNVLTSHMPLMKMLFRHPTETPGAVAEKLSQGARASANLTVGSTRYPLLEIGPKGVNKGSALAAYASARGIDAEDVVAFGDMPNDVEMLIWAGQSFAMANGHPTALNAAQTTVPGVESDGVAFALETLLTR